MDQLQIYEYEMQGKRNSLSLISPVREARIETQQYMKLN
jgi:hypothetical protein